MKALRRQSVSSWPGHSPISSQLETSVAGGARSAAEILLALLQLNLGVIKIRAKSRIIDGIGEQARRVGASVLLSESRGVPGPAGRLAEFFRALIFTGQSGEIGAGRDRGLAEIPAPRHDPIAEILGGLGRQDDAVDLNPFRIVRNHVLFRAPEFSGKILDLRARGGLKPGRKTAKIRSRLVQNEPKPLRNVVHAPRSALWAEFVGDAEGRRLGAQAQGVGDCKR